jgi:hypothetical protein
MVDFVFISCVHRGDLVEMSVIISSGSKVSPEKLVVFTDRNIFFVTHSSFEIFVFANPPIHNPGLDEVRWGRAMIYYVHVVDHVFRRYVFYRHHF